MVCKGVVSSFAGVVSPLVSSVFSRHSDIEFVTAKSMEYLLGESPRESLALARSWQKERMRIEQGFRKLTDLRCDVIEESSSQLRIPDEIFLLNFLARTTNGIVLASIHMGDYVHAIFRVASKLKGRKLLLLRRSAGRQDDLFWQEMLGKYGVQVEIFQGKSAAIGLLQGIRRGGIAILFFDLPMSWGEVHPVTVLEKRLGWVLGPARLACLGQAHLVPFTCHRFENENICKFGEILEPSDKSDRSSVACVGQYMAAEAGKMIREYPAQWHNWYLVPEMLSGIASE
jgi:lauroyl/myristoyl acyltransferase